MLDDEVEAGHFLGNGMLDLQPGIHLEEIEVTGLVDEELQGPRILIPDGPSPRHSGRGERGAGGGREHRRRRFLHELLMAALDRALPLVKVYECSMAVPEHLNFDVTRPLEISLDIERVRAERRLGASRRGGVSGGQLGSCRSPGPYRYHRPHPRP